MTETNEKNQGLWEEVLRDRGLLSKSGGVAFTRLRANLDRRDAESRRAYLVRQDGKVVCHLLVAPDLTDHTARAKLFAEAYPKLVPKHLLSAVAGGEHLYAREYVDGTTLRELLLGNQSLQQQALKVITEVRGLFQQAIRPSDPAAAIEEVEQMIERLRRLSVLRTADQVLLIETVLKVAQRELAETKLGSRVGHGDFIAHNILITPRGEPKLIDFEFSARTHFHANEWENFALFSELSPESLGVLGPIREPIPHWMRALLWVNQILKEGETNLPDVFHRNLASRLGPIVRIIQQEPRLFGRSALLETRWEISSNRAEKTAPATGAFAQLFWSKTQGAFSEKNSIRKPIAPEPAPQTLAFQVTGLPVGEPLYLRFDPAAMPALTVIERISVVDLANKTELWRADRMSPAGLLRCAGTSISLPGDRALSAFSYGSDPQIFLPAIQGRAHSDAIEVSVVFQVEPSLVQIAKILQTIAQHLPKDGAPLGTWTTLLTTLLASPVGSIEKRLQVIQEQLASHGPTTGIAGGTKGATHPALLAAEAQVQQDLGEARAALAALNRENEALSRVLSVTTNIALQLGEHDREVAGTALASHADRLQVLASIQALLQKLGQSLERERQRVVSLEAEVEAWNRKVASLENTKAELVLARIAEANDTIKALGALRDFGLKLVEPASWDIEREGTGGDERSRLALGVQSLLHQLARERDQALAQSQSRQDQLNQLGLELATVEAMLLPIIAALRSSTSSPVPDGARPNPNVALLSELEQTAIEINAIHGRAGEAGPESVVQAVSLTARIALLAKLAALAPKLATAVADQYNHSTELERQCTELRASLSQLEQRHAAGEATRASLEQHIAESDRRLERLVRSGDRAEQNEARLLGEMAFLTTSIAMAAEDTRRLSGTAQTNGTHTADDLASHLRVIEEIRARVRLIGQSRDQAQEALRRLEQAMAAGTQENQALQARLAEINQTLTAAQGRIAALEKTRWYRFQRLLERWTAKLSRRS